MKNLSFLTFLFAGIFFAPLILNAEPPAVRPSVPAVKPPAPKPPAVKPPPAAKPPTVQPPAVKPTVEDRVMGKPTTPAPHTEKPSIRATTEGTVDTGKANELVRDKEIKALMEREKIAIESDAMKGLLVEHSAFDASLGLRKEANHKTSATFETNLAKRLAGEEAFENKELKLEDIKDLQALTCKNGKDGKGGCGHSKFNLSCRRISGFLAAATTASLSVPIGKAFYAFLKSEPDKEGKIIEVAGTTENGGTLVIKDLDKPVAGEEITPARESN